MRSRFKRWCCVLPLLLALAACTTLKAHRTVLPTPGDVSQCSVEFGPPTAPGAPPCAHQATERNASYTLHFVEFDDEGIPFADAEPQIDSAIRQIKHELTNADRCVRLFVYVHGWRHDARTTDDNVASFRDFLAQVSERSKQAAALGKNACDDPTIPKARAPLRRAASTVRTVGIYVGWRGLSIVNKKPLVYASFWDRKNTADRVSQGSVRELFGRLNALAASAPPPDKPRAAGSTAQGQLRTYVIGHSFGAAIVFRALSQSLIDSFAADLDGDSGIELASVSRFVDMVVLVNPAIEAARFDPVFRAAKKRTMRCETAPGAGPLCRQPRYQAPVLAIFQSEGDLATKQAFGLGAGLSNTFENTLSEAERRSITQTIGWDDDYLTHRLSALPPCDTVANAHPYEAASSGTLRYRAPGWTWCVGDASLTQIGTAPPPSDAGTVYNGPLWNVRVAPEIAKDHSDIWNPRFREVLLALFADELVNSKILPVGVLRTAPP